MPSLQPGIIITLIASLGIASSLTAADWPCWRGPDGSGHAPSSSPLIEDLTKAKVKWVSEEKQIPTSYGFLIGGVGSPVVAEGRVILAYQQPRGEYDEAYYKRCQTAKVKGKHQSIIDHLTKNYGKSLDEMYKMKSSNLADDVILAVDLHSGKTLWKKTWEGTSANRSRGDRGAFKWAKTGPHLIACAAYGKVAAMGGDGTVYCVDATDGTELWQQKVRGTPKNSTINNGAIVFAHNNFIMTNGPEIVALDASTGKTSWKAKAGTGSQTSPIRWLCEGDPCVIAGPYGIDGQSGKILWKAAGASPGGQTPATNGEYVVYGGYGKGDNAVGMHAYAISKSQATEVWRLDSGYAAQGHCTPAIIDGHVYCKTGIPGQKGRSRFVCVELATGKVVTETEPLRNDDCTSISGMGGFFLYRPQWATASPQGIRIVSEPGFFHGDNAIDFAASHTPAMVDGLMIVRGQSHLKCFDLRK